MIIKALASGVVPSAEPWLPAAGKGTYHAGRRYFPDEVVSAFRHINISQYINSHAKRMIEGCGGPNSVRRADNTAAGKRCNNPRRTYLPDQIVALVGNIKITGGIKAYPVRIIKTCCCTRAVCTAGCATASQRTYQACRAYLAYQRIPLVADIKIIGTIDGNTEWDNESLPPARTRWQRQKAPLPARVPGSTLKQESRHRCCGAIAWQWPY